MLPYTVWIAAVGEYLHTIYLLSEESHTMPWEQYAEEEYNRYLHRSEYK